MNTICHNTRQLTIDDFAKFSEGCLPGYPPRHGGGRSFFFTPHIWRRQVAAELGETEGK